MILSAQDHERIGEAIKHAEGRTAGEIVCVVSRSSTDYRLYPLAWAFFFALACPWFLVALTQLAVKRILLAQLLVFLALAVVLSLPALARRLVPRRVQRAAAHRAASEQFLIRGVSRKANRAGVLIFVSLAERYARIVADEGIAKKVEQKVWQGAIDALRGHAGDGRLAEGLVDAIGQCGAVLATHFPPEDGKDELPDRVFVI